MSKPEWGTKHTCQSCGAKYYDMNRTPVICPKCGAEFDPDALLRSRRIRTTTTKADAAVVAPKPDKVAKKKDVEDDPDLDEIEDDDDIDALVEDDDADDSLIEDASELGEDEDDVAEVVVEGDDGDDR